MERKRFVAFDVEGDGTDVGFKSCAVWADNGSGLVRNRPEAITILKEYAEQGYTFVAHNAEYDITTLFWPERFPVKIIYYNGRFNRGEWRYSESKHICEIWDTQGLAGQLPLAKVGEAIGYPKYRTPQRLLGVDPDKYLWKCTTHGVFECEACYNIRDAEIVWRYVEHYADILSTYGVEPRRTIAGAAHALWRVLDGPGRIAIRSSKLDSFARTSYFGGRVDAFKLGAVQNVYVGDVNSMYPYVMSTTPMPDPTYLRFSDTHGISPNVINHPGITRATVNVPHSYIPTLPLNWNGKLVFGYGRLTGTWDNQELRAAVERGAEIEQVHASLTASGHTFPFTSFLSVVLGLREQFKRNNDPREIVAKILGNSLYGRLGLARYQEEEIIVPMRRGTGSRNYPGCELMDMGGVNAAKAHTWRRWRSDYSNVAWASCITAGARLVLLEAMEQHGQAMVYCDTDSIFSFKPMHEYSTALGGLKDEGTYDSGVILGPKLYSLESSLGASKIRAKGIPREHAQRFIETLSASFSQPTRPRGAFRRGERPGVWKTVSKSLRTTPSKRQPTNPTWTIGSQSFTDTSPLFISGDESSGGVGPDFP